MRSSIAFGWPLTPPYSKETEDAVSDVWIVLIGVGAGAVLSAFVPPVTHWLTKKRRRRTLALIVCPALERFIADCQAAIDDEGERPRGNRLPQRSDAYCPGVPE